MLKFVIAATVAGMFSIAPAFADDMMKCDDANMMKMQKGDRGFFYHSNTGKEIVGICEVIRTAYPDPTANAGEPWVCVDVKAIEPVPKPVTLAAIKAEPKLAEIQLLRQSRLSLPSITDAEWKFVCKMGGL